MKIDAIIFDKDGTLIDFDAFWVSVARAAVKCALGRVGAGENLLPEIMLGFGVKDGVTDVDGVLCKGTYEELGMIFHRALKRHGMDISESDAVKIMNGAFCESADAGVIKPVCESLAATLTELNARGVRLAVVTTDNELITRKCLSGLGILELFDKIYTDDGVHPTKPDPYCANDFATLTATSKDRLLMVGDTMTDMCFAKNAGIRAVGIAKTEAGRELLLPHALAVISDYRALLDIIE